MKKQTISKIAVLISVISAALLLLIFTFSTVKFNDSIDCSKDYQQERELAYWKVKSELVIEIDSYIRKVAPGSALSAMVVLNASEEFKIDLAFILAQAHIESHFGTKGIAFKTNSVWNVGAFDGYRVNAIRKKYKFEHPDQSVRPYLRLLSNDYLVNGKTEYDMMVEFINKRGQRYASYEYYEKEISTKYNEIMNSELGDKIMMFNRIKLMTHR